MKKTIAFKVDAFPQPSETFVVNSVIQAIKADYNIRIVTNHLKPISNSSQPELIEGFKLMDKISEFKQPTNKNHRLKAFFLLCLNPILLVFYIRFCLAMKKVSLDYVFYLKFYKKFRQVDVFHVHFAPALNPLLSLKKIGFLKSKIIVTFHGFDAHFLPNNKQLKKLTEDYKKYVNLITVNSNYLKEKLFKKGFQSTFLKVVPIGIDTYFFKSENKRKVRENNSFKIITIGRLIPLKGQEFGIKAISELIGKGFDVSYTVIGEGENLFNLKELVKQLKLESCVTFLGAKTQSEIKNLLEYHDIFLMTSTSDETGRREAFGLASLEAQAMGLPVIGFNSGGFPETVIDSKTGFIVNDRDIDALVEKTKMLIENPEILNNMSLNSIKHVTNKFSLAKLTNEYSELYQPY